jgi:hypothetical protein
VSKLSPQERLARIKENRQNKKGMDWGQLDSDFAQQITRVESKLHFPIFGDYPLMKFLQQYDDLAVFAREEQNANR